jgi:hypothetical protein
LTLARLSPLPSIAAAAILGARLDRSSGRRPGGHRVRLSAREFVFAGALLMLVALPGRAGTPLAVGVINCPILAVLGVAAGLPVLYVPAVACAALAVTIGMHLFGDYFASREQLPLKLVQAALRGRTSGALTVLGVIVASLAGWLMSRKKREDALVLLASTGGLAAIAILIALFSGFVPIEAWPQTAICPPRCYLSMPPV